MEFSLRVVFAAVALLTAPIASKGQEQCEFPPSEDQVKSAYETIRTNSASEGGSNLVLNIMRTNYTCLARVSLDMYSEATVVIEFTTNEDSTPQIRQFELQCFAGNVWGADPSGVFDVNVDMLPMPFDVRQTQCSECTGTSTSSDYDNVTNCVPCHADCLAMGGGFCTGDTSGDCCPFFNGETGVCVDDCATIHPRFGADNNSVCVCNFDCGPGYMLNVTNDCTCELTDVCEALGQPCQNGGTCVGNLSTSTYQCNCTLGYNGTNCSAVIPTQSVTPPTPTTTVPDCHEACSDCDYSTGCCSNCTTLDGIEYIYDDNCSCSVAPTTDETRAPTTQQPACPETCRDCVVDDPSCCSVCQEGYILRGCECVADEGRQLEAGAVAGIAIGLLLFILLILALAVLLVYVIYYVWANKEKMKKGTALSPFSNGESHSNPLYLTPEEVED